MGGSHSSIEEEQDVRRLPSLFDILIRGDDDDDDDDDNDDGDNEEDEEEPIINWDVVRQILRQEPEQACLYAHGGVEASPLFLALSSGTRRTGRRRRRRSIITRNDDIPPYDVIQLFITSYEDALDDIEPNDGCNVLHVGMYNEQIVEYILQHRPNMVQYTDRHGRLPLHFATILATTTTTTIMQDDDGLTITRRTTTTTNGQNNDGVLAAKYLIHAYPKALTHRSNEMGNLPIHSALLSLLSSISSSATLVLSNDMSRSVAELFRVLSGDLQSLSTSNSSSSSSSSISKQQEQQPKVYITRGGACGILLKRNKYGQTPIDLLVKCLEKYDATARGQEQPHITTTTPNELEEVVFEQQSTAQHEDATNISHDMINTNSTPLSPSSSSSTSLSSTPSKPDVNHDKNSKTSLVNEELWQLLLEWIRAIAAQERQEREQTKHNVQQRQEAQEQSSSSSISNNGTNNNQRNKKMTNCCIFHNDDGKVLELHTLISLGCCYTKKLMDHAIHEFQHQIIQRDVILGRTSLHIAASVGNNLCSSSSLETLIDANTTTPRMTDKEGRLPIDIAAESGNVHVQSLAVLLKGEPRAIDTRDLRDGYYPFVSAALGEHTSLNTTYYLLRAKPHVISYFHTP